MFLSVALLGTITGCNKQKPTPSIDGLSAALQRSADQTLAAPSLASEQVSLPANPGPNPGHIDAQVAEILQAASAAGGVALRSLNAQGQVSILATIPDNNMAAFKATLRHEKPPMEKPSASTSLIEVVLVNAAEKTAASPTPPTP
jgi:hypothetical protein